MHFETQTHVDNSFGNNFVFTKKKDYGTLVLLEVCKLASVQVKRFIHVSADEVYNEMDEDALVGNHEVCQLLPTNPYSATKAGVEMFVMVYGRSYSLPMITTRGNNVYWYCEDVDEAFEVVLHKGEVGHVYNIWMTKKRWVLDVVSDICKLFL
ncbi:Trifunctional UDP-glucose 4,6-dehydratase/UDP-4-keto-6-deoxy-D-glucose 3,5-epimerase/UDP-4-keto-L-rhamnose-reductase RHM1 [Linum perenne]